MKENEKKNGSQSGNIIMLNKYYRGNVNIPSIKTKEVVSKEEYNRRIAEIEKCKNDIKYFAENYFYIVSLDKGKQIIKLYNKQKEFLDVLSRYNRVVTVASRQTFKTTTYTIFCLWLAMFFRDKKILIVANKASTCYEIMSRIRFAYEMLPIWLKCPVTSYNKGSIEFANNSKIEAESTSSESARGKSVNVLIVDEAARIPKNILDEFWISIYPTISSGLNTKIIMVSTPNGISGLFYDTYMMGRDYKTEDKTGYIEPSDIKPGEWVRVRIDWWEVEGRDNSWKEAQLKSMSEEEFAQEYGNSFIISSEFKNVFSNKVLETIRQNALKIKSNLPRIGKKFTNFTGDNIIYNNLQVYLKYCHNRAYLLTVDSSSGSLSDKNAFVLWDITNLNNIITVCSFSDNSIILQDFVRLVYDIAREYNNPLIISENNGISEAFITLLKQLNYENIYISRNARKIRYGIHLDYQIKNDVINYMTFLLNNKLYNLTILDDNIISEMELYVKSESKRGSNLFKFKALNKTDDLVSCIILLFYILKPENLQRYYKILKSYKLSDSRELPLLVSNLDYNDYENVNLLENYDIIENIKASNNLELSIINNSEIICNFEKVKNSENNKLFYEEQLLKIDFSDPENTIFLKDEENESTENLLNQYYNNMDIIQGF